MPIRSRVRSSYRPRRAPVRRRRTAAVRAPRTRRYARRRPVQRRVRRR